MPGLLWVCFGGALGAGARYALSGWIQRGLGASFPCGTLAINVIGSFLLGALMTAGLLRADLFPPQLRVPITTGVLGGFTTFSTFSYETMALVQDGALMAAGLNVALNVAACIGASFLGAAAARLLLSAAV